MMDVSGIEMTNNKLYIVDEEGVKHEVAPFSVPTSIELSQGGRGYGKSFITCSALDDSADALRYCVEDTTLTKEMKKLVNKKEGNKMELLRLYNKKSNQNINEHYDLLIEHEKENDVVRKEFEELVDKFNEDLENLANKYNPYNAVKGTYIIEDECSDFDIPYSLFHDNTEKEKEINSMRVDELHKLDEKIEEINAHFQLLPIVEATSHEQVMEILKAYGVVNDVGQLTPYTPEAIGDTCCEECKCEEKKHRGRPKKESN